MLGEELADFDGVDLFDPPDLSERVRYYHFFEKKGRNGWTDEMLRYRVTDEGMTERRMIPLKRNPKPE